MSDDRIEAVSRTGRTLFASGIVLGMCLGFAMGHLFLFSRGQTTAGTEDAAPQFPPFDPGAPLLDRPAPAVSPGEISFSIMEVDDDPDVGRVTLSDVNAPPAGNDEDHLHFFPDPRNERATAEADRLTYADGNDIDHSQAPGTFRLSADVTSGVDAPPQALQPPPAAAPIDERTSHQEKVTRSIIQEEVPGATAQELDVWSEVLSGLPADDIRGILRMRKRFGSGGTPAFEGLLTTPPPTALKPAPAGPGPAISAGSDHDPTVDQRLAEIDRFNLANRETAGFWQLKPVLAQRPFVPGQTTGARYCTTLLDTQQGRIEPTGRSLDVAIDGPGFFQVRRDSRTRYTRDGRLTIDGDGRLVLLAASDWALDPPILVPAGSTRVTIDPAGRVEVTAEGTTAGESTGGGKILLVSFLDPGSLRIDDDGLYATTPASGTAVRIAADEDEGPALRQGQLESSNVDPADVIRQAQLRQACAAEARRN